jgi:hypothetical protein
MARLTEPDISRETECWRLLENELSSSMHRSVPEACVIATPSLGIGNPRHLLQKMHFRYDTMMLDHMGQEKTAARFKISESGDVLDVNHREKSLIQLTRSVRRNAGGGK